MDVRCCWGYEPFSFSLRTAPQKGVPCPSTSVLWPRGFEVLGAPEEEGHMGRPTAPPQVMRADSPATCCPWAGRCRQHRNRLEVSRCSARNAAPPKL